MFIFGNVEEGGGILNNSLSRRAFKHQLSDRDVLRRWSHSRLDCHGHRLFTVCWQKGNSHLDSWLECLT